MRSRIVVRCKKEEISKLYMIARGHLFPVYGLGNEFAYWYFLREKDVPTEISLGWNKASGCHTKPTWATFLPSDNGFSQYKPVFASAIVACRRELESVRLNYATTHHQPKYIRQPPTTSPNISTTTHHESKYIHHRPPPTKIYPPTPTTTHQQPKPFL